PKTGPLDIHPDIVDIRIPLGEPQGILPFPATQFQDYGTVVAKEGGPVAPVLEPLDNLFPCGLYHIGKSFVLPEPFEFVLTSHVWMDQLFNDFAKLRKSRAIPHVVPLQICPLQNESWWPR